MKKLRLLLLPVGAVVELSILVTCWIVSFVNLALSEQIMEWATSNLPTLYWYIGE
jgi:hypothetical protein